MLQIEGHHAERVYHADTLKYVRRKEAWILSDLMDPSLERALLNLLKTSMTQEHPSPSLDNRLNLQMLQGTHPGDLKIIRAPTFDRFHIDLSQNT